MSTHMTALRHSGDNSQKMKRITAVVCGGGNIGAGRGEKPESPHATNHASAYLAADGIDLVGIVEPDKSLAEKIGASYQSIELFKNIFDLRKKHSQVDIFCIATPTAEHYPTTLTALDFSPKLIALEKPAARSSLELQNLLDRCLQANVRVLVNYTRRYSKDIVAELEQIRNGAYGDIQNVTCMYTKGIANNGSHAIDILYSVFKKLKIRYAARRRHRPEIQDWDIDCVLIGDDTSPIHMIVSAEELYSRFSVEFACAKAVIKIDEQGKYIQRIFPKQVPEKTGHIYLDYSQLENRRTDLSAALDNFVALQIQKVSGEKPDTVNQENEKDKSIQALLTDLAALSEHQ